MSTAVIIHGFVVIGVDEKYLGRAKSWMGKEPRDALVFTSEQIAGLRKLKKQFVKPAVAIYAATYDPETRTTTVDFSTQEEF